MVVIDPVQVAKAAKFMATPLTGVALAVHNVGGSIQAGKALNVSRAVVYGWIAVSSVPSKYVLALAVLSNVHPLKLISPKLRKLFEQISAYK